MATKVLGFDVGSLVSDALGSAVDTIEIRSAFSPPVIVKTSDLLGKTKPAQPATPGAKVEAAAKTNYLKLVKPTVILTGGVGRQVIAPGGEVDPNQWKWNALLAASAVTLTLAVTFQLGRRYERRHRGRK